MLPFVSHGPLYRSNEGVDGPNFAVQHTSKLCGTEDAKLKS